MPKTFAVNRKAYTYGGAKKKGDKDDWKEICKTKTDNQNIPKKKGIWSNASNVSPFKKSPLKLTVNTNIANDLFDFDDSDTDCFNFKEDGIKTSPKKVQRTPSKLLNSPNSSVNPRLFGKSLPDESVTINVADLTPEKKKSSKINGKQFKKGTLAALKAEINSPSKKSPSKSPKKGSLAELKAKLSNSDEAHTSPTKNPKKGSLAALKEKLTSPKKTGNTKPKKSPSKVVSAKVKKTSNKSSPKKQTVESPIKSTGRKRKTEISKEKSVEPPIKRKLGGTKKDNASSSPRKNTQNKRTVSSPNKKKTTSKVVASPSKKKTVSPSKIKVSPTKNKTIAAKSKTALLSKKVPSPAKNKTASSPKKAASPTKVISSPAKKSRSNLRTVDKPKPFVRTTSRSMRNAGKHISLNESVPLKRKPGQSKKKTDGENKDSSVEPARKRKAGNTKNIDDNDEIFPKFTELPESEEQTDSLQEEILSTDKVNEESEPIEQNEDELSKELEESEPTDGNEQPVEEVEDTEPMEENEELTEEVEAMEDKEELTEEVEEEPEPMMDDEEPESEPLVDNGELTEELEASQPIEPEQDDNDENEDEDEEEDPAPKTKSLFSYYDKQKKNPTDNIYGDSKKNIVIFDDIDGDDNDQDSARSDENKTVNDVPQSPKASQNDAKQQCERDKKLVKSPFKSLKPNFRKYRRFSALPTDITMLGNTLQETNNEEEGEEVEDEKSSFHMSNIFGQSASSAFKVRRDEKELYTVVRDTKHAYQCLEYGESQLFKDDLEYLIDGVKSSHNVTTRCLSALELASKCISPEFRMHMKAHGMIDSIFNVLQDAHTDELLSLCTSTIMYILSKDRQKTGFSKKIIAFVLNLLTTAPTKQSEQKSFEKIHNKIKSLFEKYDDSAIDCENINSAMLARETLLSLTSQKTGEWFKEDIRTLGGLDHIADSIYSSSRCIQKREDVGRHYKQTERALLLLCDITFKCRKNQEYLVEYRDGILVDGLIRILTFITTKVDLTYDFDTSVQNCLFAILRFLTNLSHENEVGSVKICKREDALNSFLRSVLYIPKFLPEKKTFDFIVVALGLLINLTEHSKQNIAILNTAFGPACYESEASSSIDDEISPVEALTQLFLVRNEASQEGDLMEELERLEKEQDEREAAMHYHDGEDALVCGDKFDDTVEETAKEEGEEGESKEEKSEVSDQKGTLELNKKEKQDIKNTLEKAHQHMEDSHVAAYSALLIGLLAEINEENQKTVHGLLPDGDFQPMKGSLEKILAFMKMTGATNEAGFKVIQRIIDFFKNCTQTYVKKVEETNNES